ncbi:FMN-dependent NADH-azoreductase [Microbacterium sp. W4I4]|uniref:FMN-dependent NADH-azoreductase n=1 Tax=Microbacterium sp. W4I4 TaxID=3042295 RepID=UPI002780C9C3|nr:NAD(P)H-dependent oxidoreductase [Microbacterium sp. W4I4]MDQ0614794.1 FMN-dependent NADH-azoreductase [Microbacterium sp. W4I4]
MTRIFRLDASIRGEASVSRALSDTLLETLTSELGDVASVTRRDLAADPVPPTAWSLAANAGFVPEEQRTAEQVDAVAYARTLADEAAAADVLIIGAPFYNFGVSQHTKAWLDILITDSRFAPGTQPGAGKTALLVASRGGGYSEGTPRYGWDHGTPWLVRIFRDVFGYETEIIETELTLAEHTPAMAHLVDLAKEHRARAHEAAAEHGKRVAAIYTDAAAA